MRITRNVVTKTLSLGTPENIVLPRNFCTRYLTLRLSGSVDITNGTTAFVQLATGPANLLSNIRVRLDGRDTIYALSGALTYELNKLQFGRPGAITNPAITNATNVAAAIELIIPFESIGAASPFDTLVNASQLKSSFDLIIDTAPASALFSVGNGTVAVNTAFTLEVDTTEEVGVNDFNFGQIRTYLAQKVNVAGASNNFQIKPLPVGNFYKSIMLFNEITAAMTGSDALVTNVKVKSGTDVFIDRPYQGICDEYAQRLNIDTRSTGLCYLDFLSDGRHNQCLDLRDATGRRTAELELVTASGAATSNIYVVVQEYIPPVVIAK